MKSFDVFKRADKMTTTTSQQRRDYAANVWCDCGRSRSRCWSFDVAVFFFFFLVVCVHAVVVSFCNTSNSSYVNYVWYVWTGRARSLCRTFIRYEWLWMSNARAVCLCFIAGGSCSFGLFALLVLCVKCAFFVRISVIHRSVNACRAMRACVSVWMCVRLRLVFKVYRQTGHSHACVVPWSHNQFTIQCVRAFSLHLSRCLFRVWLAFFPEPSTNHFDSPILCEAGAMCNAFGQWNPLEEVRVLSLSVPRSNNRLKNTSRNGLAHGRRQSMCGVVRLHELNNDVIQYYAETPLERRRRLSTNTRVTIHFRLINTILSWRRVTHDRVRNEQMFDGHCFCGLIINTTVDDDGWQWRYSCLFEQFERAWVCALGAAHCLFA